MHTNIKFTNPFSMSFQELESLKSDIEKLVSVVPMEADEPLRRMLEDATVKERNITVSGCVYPPKEYRIDDFAHDDGKRVQVGSRTYKPEEVKEL